MDKQILPFYLVTNIHTDTIILYLYILLLFFFTQFGVKERYPPIKIYFNLNIYITSQKDNKCTLEKKTQIHMRCNGLPLVFTIKVLNQFTFLHLKENWHHGLYLNISNEASKKYFLKHIFLQRSEWRQFQKKLGVSRLISILLILGLLP